LAAGCRKSSDTPTTPSSTVTTQTFAGTVAVGGANSHTFTVAQPGEVDVTLTSASPPADVVMGLGVGTPSDSSCAVLAGASTNTKAGSSAQLTGRVTAGSFCVQISDVGNQTAPVSYSISVQHP